MNLTKYESQEDMRPDLARLIGKELLSKKCV